MQFTKFLLDNYLQTDEGKNALNFFKNLPGYVRAGDPDKIVEKFINNLLITPLANEFYKFNQEIPTVEYSNFEDFSNDAINIFHHWVTEENISYRDIVEDIPNLSIILYSESRQFAFPYLFPIHFFRVQEICEIFDIVLPQIPNKTKYEDKCLYYLQLCKVFYEFRTHHRLSPEEFCVFFYSFAQHFLSNPLIDEMPPPLKSWLAGANPHGDHDVIQKITPASARYWQGNIETRSGDIILIYERAPYSHISSIWRAITPGYDDPFRYYPGVIWIGCPTAIPPISLDELKTDPIWQQKGLVKANMQGVSGRACSREEYEALLALLKQKNFDTSSLPTLPQNEIANNKTLTCEQDVEKHLLEPFLRLLGLTENDWMRQMPLRMGRRIRYYPDYVIHADTRRDDEKGAVICEAKFRILTKKQLEESFLQAKSYARRLGCRGIILASCDGIWLSLAQDNYYFEKIQSFRWGDLNNSDIFHLIKMQFDKLLKKRTG